MTSAENPDAPPERRSGAFFGRRKTQKLSPKQEALFETLLPRLKLDPDSSPPANLNQLFGHQKVYLEIGFGGGEHLIHEARNNPDTGFIGVEPFINSMAKALTAIEGENLQNIRLYDEDATRLLDWLPENSIYRIDLLYPDPWPKKRHWKRRFLNPDNLDRFARILVSGGMFRFASDIDTYVNWALHHCDRHPEFEWTATVADDWRKPWENWPSTRYEAKAVREGRSPCYLVFQRR